MAARGGSKEATVAGAVSEGDSRERGVQLLRPELEHGRALSWVGACPCECWCKRVCACGRERGHCLGCPAEEGSKEFNCRV